MYRPFIWAVRNFHGFCRPLSDYLVFIRETCKNAIWNFFFLIYIYIYIYALFPGFLWYIYASVCVCVCVCFIISRFSVKESRQKIYIYAYVFFYAPNFVIVVIFFLPRTISLTVLRRLGGGSRVEVGVSGWIILLLLLNWTSLSSPHSYLVG